MSASLCVCGCARVRVCVCVTGVHGDHSEAKGLVEFILTSSEACLFLCACVCVCVFVAGAHANRNFETKCTSWVVPSIVSLLPRQHTSDLRMAVRSCIGSALAFCTLGDAPSATSVR